MANGPIVVSCYPNPAVDEVKIQYYVERAGEIFISIGDTQGREVYRTVAEVAAGVNNGAISLAGLPAGTYLLTLGTDSGSVTTKVQKMR